MARAANFDVLDKYRWVVDIEGFERLGFMTTSTPSYEITSKEYREGGNHLQPKQIVDSVKYTPVTLSRGVSVDTSFNKWATGFIDSVQDEVGSGKTGFDAIKDPTSYATSFNDQGCKPVKTYQPLKLESLGKSPPPLNYRRTVSIFHKNSTGQTVCAYKLYGAFPIMYKPASDFDAMADDAVSVESLTLAYESFEVLYSGLSGALAEALTKK